VGENDDMDISDRLSRLALFYHREASKCERGRAYLAACVMQGAALEALFAGHVLSLPGRRDENDRIPEEEVSNEETQGS
jgi:hypothetical protein